MNGHGVEWSTTAETPKWATVAIVVQSKSCPHRSIRPRAADSAAAAFIDGSMSVHAQRWLCLINRHATGLARERLDEALEEFVCPGDAHASSVAAAVLRQVDEFHKSRRQAATTRRKRGTGARDSSRFQ